MQTEQLLCQSDMTDTEHSATSKIVQTKKKISLEIMQLKYKEKLKQSANHKAKLTYFVMISTPAVLYFENFLLFTA